MLKGISVFASDVDSNRLAALSKIAAPLTKKHRVRYSPYNAGKEKVTDAFDYTVLMAQEPQLVAASVKEAARDGIINIFAGLPATVTARVDLDAYIEKRLYFIGTSGSVLEDMKQVLAKAESGRLNTEVCVAAVCGLDGAADGIRAVENRAIAGKIIVYPACKGLQLTELAKLKEKMPEVANCLESGFWNLQAEKTLLQLHK